MEETVNSGAKFCENCGAPRMQAISRKDIGEAQA